MERPITDRPPQIAPPAHGLDAFGEALWVLDAAGRIGAANARALGIAAVTGQPAQVLLARLARRRDLQTHRTTWQGQEAVMAIPIPRDPFRIAAAAAGLTVFDWDMDSNTLQWTCEGGDAFGYDTSVFPGRLECWLQRVHPDDRARMVGDTATIPDDAATGRDFWQERYRLLRADGSVAQVLDRGITLRDATGTARRMIGAMIDVSELHEAETRFSEVTAAATEVLFIFDLDTARDWWSEVLTRHYGHPRHADHPRTGIARWLSLIHPEDRPRTEAAHLRAMASDADQWQGEYRMARADGGHVPVLHRSRFIRHADGRISRALGTIVDISALRDGQERFRLASRAAQDVIYEYNPVTGDIWLSDNYVPIFGLDPQARDGEPGSWRHAIHPDDFPRIAAEFSAALAQNRPRWEYAYRVQRGDGRIAHVIDRAIAQRGEDGGLLRVIGSIIDITSLREEGERLRALLHVAADAIYEVDLRANTSSFSEGMQRAFGLDWEGTHPRPTGWGDAIHPDDRARVLRGFNAFIAGRQTDWRADYRMRRGDGSYAYTRDRARALRDDTGEAFRIIGSLQDVSAEAEAADRLQQAERLDAVGKLTGGVAHDFNNLLSVILGNADFLLEGAATAETRHQAAAIAQAAARGADLVASLLSFGRRQPLQPQPLAPRAVMAELMRMLERTLPADVRLELALPDGLWPVEADPTQLQTALLNLAINACDAMPDGGRLGISVANVTLDASFVALQPEARAGDFLRICLADTGSGMTADVQKQAFVPFFTTKPAGRGSGLGLSMVHGFARQSGGHVCIHSAPGKGTEVRLFLPRSRAQAATGPDSPVAELPRGQGQHIMVAEDDPSLCAHVKRLIESLGYRASTAPDGATALAAIRAAGDVALLFTDVVMPGELPGRLLAERAQAEFPGLKVLFTSGYADSFIVHQGRLDPGVHLLAKPYRRDELGRKIHDLLNGAPAGEG